MTCISIDEDFCVCKCTLPALIAIASHSVKVAKVFASSGSVLCDLAPSLYPTKPISPSTEIFCLCANSTISLVFSTFSLSESLDPSNIIDVNPLSIASKHSSLA